MVRTLKHISLLGILLTVFAIGFSLVMVGVVQKTLNHQPALVIQGGMLSNISARSVYIFDLETEVEIFSRQAQEVRPIASITKLVSAALFLEHATATDIATVTWADIDTEGRSGRLNTQQQYQNQELLFPALLESSNDAAAVMRRVSPVDLVATMNQYTAAHALPHTHFTDTSGLDDGNVSTAYELGLLATALYRECPHIFDITRLKTYLNDINAWMNNNPFVRDEGYRGGKHGYTYAANRTTVAFFDEPLSSGQKRTIGYVLLGSESLQTDMERLRTFVHESVVFR